MPIQMQLPPQRSGLAGGLINVLEGLKSHQGRQSQDQIFQSMGLPGGLAYLDPDLQKTLINGFMKQGGMGGQGDYKHQAAVEKSNAPFTKENRLQERILPRLEEDVREALNITENAGAGWKSQQGPLLGKLPAISQSAQALDQLNNRIVDSLAALENVGGNVTNMKIKLKQAGKASREQHPKVAERIYNGLLNDIQKEKQKLATKDRIVELNGGYEPARFESLTKRVQAIMDRLPSDLPVGTVGEDGGFTFQLAPQGWELIGRAQ